jgi:disulfide bond formation protein DsbB
MPRLGYALGFLACAGLLAFAYYLQYYEYQDPCPLCILQRVAFMALAAVFLVAAAHGPGRTGAIVYSGILVTAAAIGAAIAARHVWLQSLPRDLIPECGPGLEYLLKQLPLTHALEKIFAGSGDCAEVGWTFLGLSIAGWSLAWFMLLGGFAMFLALAAMAQRSPR